MGRKKHCSVEKRNLIIKMKNDGFSLRKIASIVQCSLGMVQNAIKYQKKEEKRGRPRKTTKQMDRQILRQAKIDPFVSTSQILVDTGANVSRWTIQRRLAEQDLKCYSPRKVPLLSKKHLQDRVKFAKEHLSWDGDEGFKKWKNILFSDESKFMLFGNDGKNFVRRPKNQAFNPLYTKKTIKHGGGNILVWSCFSWYGVGPIFLIDEIMTKDVYIDILQKIMLPYAEWNMPLLWTFQHDNDPKHTAKATRAWLETNNINVLPWPAQSPDLNPIENLWKQVKDKLKNTRPSNKGELWTAVQDAWYSIPVERCRRLIESMPNRCRSVLQQKGHAIKY